MDFTKGYLALDNVWKSILDDRYSKDRTPLNTHAKFVKENRKLYCHMETYYWYAGYRNKYIPHTWKGMLVSSNLKRIKESGLRPADKDNETRMSCYFFGLVDGGHLTRAIELFTFFANLYPDTGYTLRILDNIIMVECKFGRLEELKPMLKNIYEVYKKSGLENRIDEMITLNKAMFGC